MTTANRQPNIARYPTVRDWIAVAVVFGAAAAADLALVKHQPLQQACAATQVSAGHLDPSRC